MKNNSFSFKKLFSITAIIIVALFFRLYNLENRYTFEWDQEDDAVKVMEMINLHKPRLIGPRVANDNSFFVGPYHYYFLVPFYFLTKGDPIAGAYAVIAVGVITCLVAYFTSNSIFKSPSGLIAGLIIAATPNLVSWNVMYASLNSLLTLYFCIQLIKLRQSRYFYLSLFILSLAGNTHLVPASLIIPVIFSILVSGYRPKFTNIVIGLIVFVIPFIPLIIFDFRHQFLNITKLVEFITKRQVSPVYFPLLFLRSFWRSLGVLSLFPKVFERIVTLAILLSGVLLAKTLKNKLLFIVWILTPLLLLSFYRGDIPEYYYGSVTVLIPVFTAAILSKIKPKFIIIIFILPFVFHKTKQIMSGKSHVSLGAKESVVNSILKDSKEQKFSVSYNLPAGWNSGYEYLFQKYPKKVANASLQYLIYHTSSAPAGIPIYGQEALGVVRR
jgi:hypothetical protein